MTNVSFAELALVEPIQRAIAALNYITPTPIQAQAIPHLLDNKDLLGCAQTGTGKTAAFALPILNTLTTNRKPVMSRHPRALVLSPTRELAVQISDSFRAYGKFLRLSHTVVYGGVSQRTQVHALNRGVDILVATPGRLMDLMNQKYINLSKVEIFVLDEADRMLDMGFIRDIRKIITTIPAERQTVFFSATMPPEIQRLADELLSDPVRVQVTPSHSTAERVEQKVMFVEKSNKSALLSELLKDESINRALVFTRTKHGADRLSMQLERLDIVSEAIHGNKSQAARSKALDKFRTGRVRVLVATDVAARGIDVDGITHVINYDLPNEPESYIHRIGRTGRAGASGVAFSFCDREERGFLRNIERLIRQRVPVESNHPYNPSRMPSGGNAEMTSQDAFGDAGPARKPQASRGRSYSNSGAKPRSPRIGEKSSSPTGPKSYSDRGERSYSDNGARRKPSFSRNSKPQGGRREQSND
jgi:ATP-dependent RNA helicase RhlE